MKEKEHPISIRGEVGATVKYERTKSTTEVVPADVSRAKAGAWLDLISPLTEWAGLKGDALRHKREMLRLYREDVLAEIAQRTHKRLGRALDDLRPMPVKFLVPFLEQASLEDINSPLVELWSNLLASAAEGYDPTYVHFSSVMSRLSAKQAEVLKNVIGTESAHELELGCDQIATCYHPLGIQNHLSQLASKESPEEIASFLYEFFDCPGLDTILVAFELDDSSIDINVDYQLYSDDQEVDYAILRALELLGRHDLDIRLSARLSVVSYFHYLTDLGFHFAKACKIVS
ncbi:MAG: Abi-alpha family protein [Propylenella sp.]